MTSPSSAGTRARSWRFLARPGWVGGTLAAVAFAVVCWTVLAPWQFGRHAERSADNARIAAAATAAPRPVTERLSTTTPLNPSQTWQPVTATGVFEPENEVYVRLRQDAAGRPASEVLVPLRLADGNALLVDRGYVTVADLGAGLPVPPPPAGEVTVTGRLQPFQPDPLARQSSTAADGRTEVTGHRTGRHPRHHGPSAAGLRATRRGQPRRAHRDRPAPDRCRAIPLLCGAVVHLRRGRTARHRVLHRAGVPLSRCRWR